MNDKPTSRSMALFAAVITVCTLWACTAYGAEPKKPQEYPVSITSEPAGAAVTIDKTSSGTTPLSTALQSGLHLLEFRLAGYETAFSNIRIGTDPVSENIKLTPVTSTVLVESEPSGATITRDGANAGVTPLLMPEVPIGRYRIEISLTGYKSQQVELTVAGSTPQRIKAMLVSSSAGLDITSEPSGAGVTLNGIYRGETPIKIEKIQEGQSVLEVSAEGYAPYKEQLQLSAGEVFSVHVPMQPLPSKLTIITTPPAARVYVENEYKGESPLEIENLHAGTYRIRVEKETLETMARSVEVGNNKTVTEEFRMTANVGGLHVITSPAEVTVFIGGKAVGTTMAKADATDQISEPLEIKGIPIGEQDVSFIRKGYAEIKRKVEIKRDEMTLVESVKLSRLFIPDVEVQTKNGIYKGVYIGKTPDFYRIETSPGLIRSFPNADIAGVRLIRDENVAVDNVETNTPSENPE